MVTRSGTNDWHGSGYFFYRDHNMAAYPQPVTVSTSDCRIRFSSASNPGASLGGPIKKDKLFFFFNYEYLNQVQAVASTTTTPPSRRSPEPMTARTTARQITARFDYHLNAKNNLFLRYSHDGNAGFGQSLISGDPSSWPHNTNWADQGIIGLTSALTPTIVNDLRFQYNYWGNNNDQAVAVGLLIALRGRRRCRPFSPLSAPIRGRWVPISTLRRDAIRAGSSWSRR